MAATATRRSRAPRRSVAQQATDALAADYYIKGFNVAEVAGKVGYRSKAGAWGAIQRGISDRAKWRLSKDEMFVQMLESLHLQRKILHEIIETPHYACGPGGRVAYLHDEERGKDVPLIDDGPKLRALSELRQLEITIATFADLKPPSRRRVETISRDAVDAAIEDLESKLGKQSGAGRRTA